MTKQETLKLFKEHARQIVAPETADKFLEPFGETIKSLKIKPKKSKEFYHINCNEETGELLSVAIYEVARALAEKKNGVRLSSMMNGIGSYSEDITKKAIESLSN